MMKLCFLSVFLSVKCIGLSQQSDTTATAVDSVVAEDSAYYNEEGEEYEDSVKKAKYNYYINRNDWEDETFDVRQVPAKAIDNLKRQDDFWYADKEFEKEKNGDGPLSGNFFDWLARQQWYKVLAWIIIIGGFIAVLIWYLASSNVSLFRRKSKSIAGIANEENNENIFEINYQREIENAMQGGNYRLATRLLFLRLLKSLAEKNIIQYKQDRTNFDYLLQLSNTGYYKDFFRLTRNYEYAWYGEFDVSRDAFTIIKNDFDNFNNRL
jgi:hypothetical protein